jgi:hypothetical protein
MLGYGLKRYKNTLSEGAAAHAHGEVFLGGRDEALKVAGGGVGDMRMHASAMSTAALHTRRHLDEPLALLVAHALVEPFSERVDEAFAACSRVRRGAEDMV